MTSRWGLKRPPQLRGCRAGHYSCDVGSWGALAILSGELAEAGEILQRDRHCIILAMSVPPLQWQLEESDGYTPLLDAAGCRRLAGLFCRSTLTCLFSEDWKTKAHCPTAFFAIDLRSAAVNDAARALPPLRPPNRPSATAAGFFFWLSL